MTRRDAFVQGLTQVGSGPLPQISVLLLTTLATFAPLTLYLDRMSTFTMEWDDFPFVYDALDWQRARESLWKPFSTHLCPLFRLLTCALVGYADTLPAIPNSLCLGAMVGLVVVLLLLYEFVRRETGTAVAGLCAVLIGGMTTTYFQAVGLYATSQALWALAFTLIALLCLQGALRSGRRGAVLGAMLASAAAPAWFSGGLVAGLVGSIYAWLSTREGRPMWRRGLMVAAPLLGTISFIALALVVAGHELLAPENFGDREPWHALRPDVGAYLTTRCLTEHLMLWNLGIQASLDVGQFLVYFSVLLACVTYWLRRAPHRCMAICGLALMLSSYMLVYSFRSYMPLDSLRIARWYILFPHIGWTLFLVAGLGIPPDPPFARGGTTQRGGALVTVRDAACLALLGLALFLVHRPAAAEQARAMENPRQIEQLGQLELIEETCQLWEVDATVLSRTIGIFYVSGSAGFDGLRLIDPPAAGRPWSPEEVGRGIREVLRTGSPKAFGSSNQQVEAIGGKQ